MFLVSTDVSIDNEEDVKTKEQAILDLGHLLKLTKKAKGMFFSLEKTWKIKIFSLLELADLIKFTRPFLNFVSKAKAAKLVRNLVDMFLDLEAGTGQEISLCTENIEWAKLENRTFLRQALEVI